MAAFTLLLIEEDGLEDAVPLVARLGCEQKGPN